MEFEKFESTKEYLKQVSKINRIINNRLIELAQLKKMSYGIPAIQNKERIDKTKESDKIGNVCIKIEEMEEQINKLIDHYVDRKQKIISQIEEIENELSYHILYSIYILGKSIEEISVETPISYRHAARIHKRALKEFENKFGNEYLK